MQKRAQRMVQWVKNRKEWVFFWCAVVLCFAMSFGVGYFIGKQRNSAPIVIEKKAE